RGLSLAEQGVVSGRLAAADPSYRARVTSDGYSLVGGGMAAELSRGGASVRSGAASLSFSPVGLGRGDRVRALSGAVVSARGNRVDLMRSGIRESYVAGPLGIEQSFTLPHRRV